MQGRPKKYGRQKDLTDELLSDALDDDRVERQQRFSKRAKFHQQNKIVQTALMRAEEEAGGADVETLPVGTVIQVFSVYSEVEQGDGTTCLCVVRKTLTKLMDTKLVVGDLVRFRTVEGEADGSPQGVVEQILPRRTVLARADSFKAIEVHPIVANADQMLIVASLHQPDVKWGLVDRMLVAAQSGGLAPIVCLNKVDLAESSTAMPEDDEFRFAQEALAHYASIGIATLQTSVTQNLNLDALRETLRDHTTVLAGHSGVGKSSLIHAIQPSLDLRIGAISRYTNKGRHTTTFARRYPLEGGGHVIDTPGVKVFGIWNVAADRLIDFFPDVAAGTAPDWRCESYERILGSVSD